MKELTAQYRLKRLFKWPVADGTWLGIGCANGVFVAATATFGIDGNGIELSSTAVNQAKQKGLSVIQSQIEDLPSHPQYACMTAFDVIEQVPKPGEFLRGISVRLSPRGICALTLPNVNSIFSRVMGICWWYYVAQRKRLRR